MSEQQQNSWPGWVLGTLLGLALGVAIGMQLGQEASPNQEVAQWVEAGFSEEESRILVSYGRAKLLPSEIRRLAQGGEPRPTAREGQAPARRSTQASAPAQSLPSRCLNGRVTRFLECSNSSTRRFPIVTQCSPSPRRTKTS